MVPSGGTLRTRHHRAHLRAAAALAAALSVLGSAVADGAAEARLQHWQAQLGQSRYAQRCRAARMLGYAGDARHVAALANVALHDRARDPRIAATFALAQIGGPAAQEAVRARLLMDAGSADAPEASLAASAFALGCFPDQGEALAPLIPHANREVELAAIRACAMTGGDAAAGALLRATREAAPENRVLALSFARGMLPTAETAQFVREPAQPPGAEGALPDDETDPLTWALARAGDPAAAEALIASLASPQSRLRTRAILGLGRAGGGQAESALRRLALEALPLPEQTAWIEALAVSAAPDASQLLLPRLADSRQTVRRLALRAMVFRGPDALRLALEAVGNGQLPDCERELPAAFQWAAENGLLEWSRLDDAARSMLAAWALATPDAPAPLRAALTAMDGSPDARDRLSGLLLAPDAEAQSRTALCDLLALCGPPGARDAVAQYLAALLPAAGEPPQWAQGVARQKLLVSALSAAAALDAKQCAPSVMEALGESPAVRCAALQTVSGLRPEGGGEVVARGLCDEDERVRRAALLCLRGDPVARPGPTMVMLEQSGADELAALEEGAVPFGLLRPLAFDTEPARAALASALMLHSALDEPACAEAEALLGLALERLSELEATEPADTVAALREARSHALLIYSRWLTGHARPHDALAAARSACAAHPTPAALRAGAAAMVSAGMTDPAAHLLRVARWEECTAP